MKEYPTAQVEVEVEDRVMLLKAGVVPGLLKDVLLGTDVNDLVSLATVPEVCVHAVTRAQAKHQTQEDAEVRTREATSGARPRDIGSEVEVGTEIGTGSENPVMALGRLEDDVFGGVGRPRKTRKQRREAVKGRLGRPGNTPEGQGGSESQKATDPQPGEGCRDLEERLPAGIPRTIGADELKKLQAEDPSLTQVRRCTRTDGPRPSCPPGHNGLVQGVRPDNRVQAYNVPLTKSGLSPWTISVTPHTGLSYIRGTSYLYPGNVHIRIFVRCSSDRDTPVAKVQ